MVGINQMITILIFFLILNFLLFINIQKISKFFGIFDYPDKVNKKHKKTTAAIGGLLFFMNFICLLLFCYFFNVNLILFETKREWVSLILFLLTFLFMGVIDDKFKISVSSRIFFSIFILIIVIFINDNLMISNLKFSFFDRNIFLNNFTYIFTILSILIFLHITNMIDGINGLLISYYIIINSFLIYFTGHLIYFFIFPVLLILLTLNLRGKIFLGNNGSYTISAFYSFMIIYEYNFPLNKIFADQLIILMLVPGLELIRLSLTRSLSGKNIFMGDRNHIHHLLEKKFKNNLASLLIFSFILLLSLLSIFFIEYSIFIIFFTILIYFLTIIVLKN